MQCPGYGRGGQREHIHILPEPLDLLLVGDAEALLLVHHQQSQILIRHIIGKQPVCAYDDIDAPLAQGVYGAQLLLPAAEAREHIHRHREALHALREGIEMLLRQYGGGYQHRYLFAVLHRLEGGSDGDLRLTEAHIAAYEPVHDAAGLHIRLGILYGRQLVLGLLIWKSVLELPLPHGIPAEGDALRRLTSGIQLHQILGYDLHRCADLGLGTLPLVAPQAVQPDMLLSVAGLLLIPGVAPHVFLYDIQSGGQHIQIGAVGIPYLDVIPGHAVGAQLLYALVDAQPVILMYDIVPHLEVGEAGYPLPTLIALTPAPGALLLRENIALRDDHETGIHVFEAAADGPVIGHDLPGLQRAGGVLAIEGVYPQVA